MANIITNAHERKWADALDVANFQDGGSLGNTIDDLEVILWRNDRLRKALADKNSGRPGYYYGRDIVIEGSAPLLHHIWAADKYGGDVNWFQDDKKFENFMKDNPQFDWRNG